MKPVISIVEGDILVTFNQSAKTTKFDPKNGFFVKKDFETVEQFVELIKSYGYEITPEQVKIMIIKDKLK